MLKCVEYCNVVHWMLRVAYIMRCMLCVASCARKRARVAHSCSCMLQGFCMRSACLRVTGPRVPRRYPSAAWRCSSQTRRPPTRRHRCLRCGTGVAPWRVAPSGSSRGTVRPSPGPTPQPVRESKCVPVRAHACTYTHVHMNDADVLFSAWANRPCPLCIGALVQLQGEARDRSRPRTRARQELARVAVPSGRPPQHSRKPAILRTA